MTKYILGFIIFIIVGALVIILLSNTGILGKKATATFGTQKVTLDVADNEKSRETGLSGRSSLADNKGMLFLFDEPGIPTFWMKGMKFPIDIIFLNTDKVVTIFKNVPAPATTTETPNTYYQPTYPSNKVIELKAGAADKYNIHEGDTIKLSL
ncbi:hypothetical protein BH09PAT1_BH09PAT1_7920 [soil metagenome]